MNRSPVRFIFGLMLATCFAVMAEKPHQWETATVISQRLTTNSSTVVVFTGGNSYVWQEFTRSPDWHDFIVLVHDQTVHDQVKFYRDGRWFMVLDDQGEMHRFGLIRATKFE